MGLTTPETAVLVMHLQVASRLDSGLEDLSWQVFSILFL